MKVLVTGGAGFVGSTLVPMLLGEGFQVRVLDSLMYGGLPLLPFFSNPKFEFQRGDVRDRDAVTEAARDCDVIIHLAAIVGFPACRRYPDLAESVNVDGSRVIAKVAGRSRLVLFASTGSNYGALTDGVCTEETPLRPLSLYGKTKTHAEAHLLESCDTIAYRFATAFGLAPRLRLDLLINDFTYRALAQRNLIVYERHFMRSFIHVRDVARSFMFALDHAEGMRGQVYNVGSESMNYSKDQICQLLQKKVDFYLHYADIGKDADQRNYVVSYEKIHRLGFETTTTVEEGIDELIRGMAVVDVREPYSNV